MKFTQRMRASSMTARVLGITAGTALLGVAAAGVARATASHARLPARHAGCAVAPAARRVGSEGRTAAHAVPGWAGRSRPGPGLPGGRRGRPGRGG